MPKHLGTLERVISVVLLFFIRYVSPFKWLFLNVFPTVLPINYLITLSKVSIIFIERRKTMAKKKPIPARSPEARENQLINLAMNLAEEKLLNGTASSQIITALLNLGTAKHKLEKLKIESDLEVAQAKVDHLKAQESHAGLYQKALEAFKSYQSSPTEEGDDYEYYD